MTDQQEHPVGYMSPPVHSRFKKGRSGNPKGRPRKQEDLWALLQRVLDRKVKLQGSDRQMPIREALIRKLRELALAGDRRALTLQRRILDEAGAGEEDHFDPEERRQRILELMRRLGARVVDPEAKDG